jgi:hypothetical protein
MEPINGGGLGSFINRKLEEDRAKFAQFGLTADTPVAMGEVANPFSFGLKALSRHPDRVGRLTRSIKLKDGSRLSGWNGSEKSQTLMGYDKNGEAFTVALDRMRGNAKYWLDNIVDSNGPAKDLLNWLRR